MVFGERSPPTKANAAFMCFLDGPVSLSFEVVFLCIYELGHLETKSMYQIERAFRYILPSKKLHSPIIEMQHKCPFSQS